jgi:hypothetical protein
MLTSECDRCKQPTTLGDTYGAGFPTREGMWGRDYQTVIFDNDLIESKWQVQFGVFNNNPDLTLCAGCVLDIMAKVLAQAGKKVSHGRAHDDASEHPDVHEVSAAPDVPAARADGEPYWDYAVRAIVHQHDGLVYPDETCSVCRARGGPGSV